MRSGSTVGLADTTFKAVAIAAALACGVGPSMAADATLNITSFSVSAADFSGNFAWAMDPYQSFTMSALEAGGLYGSSSDNYSADNWNLGRNALAQTANVKATGNTVQFTDAATQLTTAGFNLAAQATAATYPLPALSNYANASAIQSGTVVLLDGDGNLTAGTITFNLYYDMRVAAPNNSPAQYSQTALNLLASSDGGGNTSFSDGLLSTALASGTGSTSGYFTWTYTVTAGQAAYYTLSGSAISMAAAVPEPGTYALMGLGLTGIGALVRRRRSIAA